MNISERRLLNRGYMNRWWEQTKNEYLDPRGKDALGAAAGIAGGILNTVTGLPDAVFGDIARGIEGRKDVVPPLTGHIARLRDTTRGFISDVVHFRPFSALTKVIKVPGDAAMDGFDLLTGNDHR